MTDNPAPPNRFIRAALMKCATGSGPFPLALPGRYSETFVITVLARLGYTATPTPLHRSWGFRAYSVQLATKKCRRCGGANASSRPDCAMCWSIRDRDPHPNPCDECHGYQHDHDYNCPILSPDY